LNIFKKNNLIQSRKNLIAWQDIKVQNQR